MTTFRPSTTTVPEAGRPPDPKNRFRQAIQGLLLGYDRYEMKPGSTLSLKLPKEEVLSGGGNLAFVMSPGTILSDTFSSTVIISAFWLLPSDAQSPQTMIRYFCGKRDDVVRECLDKPLCEEMFIGRKKPVFEALVGLKIVSQNHARLHSFLEPQDCVIKITDGGPERSSSYGSTVLTHPGAAISHTGEVIMRLHSEDRLKVLR